MDMTTRYRILKIKSLNILYAFSSLNDFKYLKILGVMVLSNGWMKAKRILEMLNATP